MRHLWFQLVAASVILGLLAGFFFYGFPVVFKTLLVISAILLVLAAGARFRKWRADRSDPYSLNKLNEIIKDKSFEEFDVPDVDPDGDKYCLRCHHIYGAHFGVCPRCGQ